MRISILLRGLQLGLDDVARLGWATVVMTLAVVMATLSGTWWPTRTASGTAEGPALALTVMPDLILTRRAAPQQQWSGTLRSCPMVT